MQARACKLRPLVFYFKYFFFFGCLMFVLEPSNTQTMRSFKQSIHPTVHHYILNDVRPLSARFPLLRLNPSSVHFLRNLITTRQDRHNSKYKKHDTQIKKHLENAVISFIDFYVKIIILKSKMFQKEITQL